MLYISRRIGDSYWGIVDTDDGSETKASYMTIVKAINMGVDIAGVSVSRRFLDNKCTISSIDVYQDKSQVSRIQVKTAMMRGVEVRTSGDTITHVTWDGNELRPGTRIKLSDYGKKCAASLFMDHNRSTVKKLIVELDDNLRVLKDTFRDATSYGVVLDLTKLNDNRIVWRAYESWITRPGTVPLDEYIIDRPERFKVYEGVAIVRLHNNKNRITFSPETTASVERFFIDEFRNLLGVRLCLSAYHGTMSVLRDHLIDLRTHRKFWLSGCKDYEEVRARDRVSVFYVLSRTTTLNPLALMDFQSYMLNFEPSEEVKRIYTELVVKANVWMLELALEKGW